MAISARRLGAIGLSPRLVRTWNPTLVRDLRLLVPIHLDALVVRAEAVMADCHLRPPPPDAPAPPDAFDLLPPPFTDLRRPPGVHLHWALPDALTRVDAGVSPPAIPAAPDRWLVVRLSPDPQNGARRLVTAFVLRADGREATPPTPLDQWVEPGPAPERLTAFGGGDPAWAAYYDNCLNRLAFYDDLAGVPPGPLAYLVCGWHADAAADPLASVRTRQALADRLASLRWSADGFDMGKAQNRATARIQAANAAGLETRERVDATPLQGLLRERAAERGVFERAADPVPRACLYHGAVVRVGWPEPLGDEVGGPPDARALHVVIGQGGAEALGTLVAADAGEPELARLVAALALGGLHELEEPDGRVRVDDRIHEAAFAGLSLDPATTERIWESPAEGYKVPDPPRSGGRPVRVPGAPKRPVPEAAVRVPFAVSPTPKVHGQRANLFQIAWPQARPRITAGYRDVQRAAPRFYVPAEPTVLIQGGARAFKHGGDGRFDAEGRLHCRVTGGCVDELAVRLRDDDRVPLLGDQVLSGGLDHGGLPPECQELLEELALLDPGTAEALARSALPAPFRRPIRVPPGRRPPRDDGLEAALAAHNAAVGAAAEVIRTEQTAWWALRDPAVDPGGLLAFSGAKGTLPSPIGLRPASKPWVPVHLDWEVELLPSADGVRAWTPGEIDFEPVAEAAATPRILAGRSLLAGGLTQAVSLTAREVLNQAARAGGTEAVKAGVEAHPSPGARDATERLGGVEAQAATAQGLDDLVAALAGMDVLTGSLDGLLHQLRAGVSPEPGSPLPKPDDFMGFFAGRLRLRRLRLVDAFGQTADLVTPQAVRSGLRWSAALATADARTGLSPPRFSGPARLHFRFMDAADRTQQAGADRSPVCGYLLPDHLDGALEVFAADATALGQVQRDAEVGSRWENAPGRPTAVGADPARAVPHPDLAGLAQALVDRGPVDRAAGRETALDALLRLIDSSLWTVDPFGHVGEEHLALLIGHPIAVVRAELRLELRERVEDPDLAVVRVPVRLGSLAHWQDGLLGYFVDEDWHRFRPTHAAAAQQAHPAPAETFLGAIEQVPDPAGFSADVRPLDHPFVHPSGLLHVVPGVTYRLTLLVEPHCAVHATAGLLPRKAIGLRRDWQAGLRSLAPTFRFGPVLRDPQQIRMPVAADLGGAWTWTHRTDVDQWAEEPVTHAGHEALLPPDPAVAQEGWLRFTPSEEESDG